jgi:hypothetical protein
VTASPDYHHKRTFNWLWNDFFQKLYAKDAALTEIKCAALGYKVPVKTVNIPVTEWVFRRNCRLWFEVLIFRSFVFQNRQGIQDSDRCDPDPDRHQDRGKTTSRCHLSYTPMLKSIIPQYATVTTKVNEIVPVTETKKSTVTVTIQPTTAAAPTQTPIKDSYPVCSGSTGSGVSWAHYAGVSYSLDSVRPCSDLPVLKDRH